MPAERPTLGAGHGGAHLATYDGGAEGVRTQTDFALHDALCEVVGSLGHRADEEDGMCGARNRTGEGGRRRRARITREHWQGISF